MESCQFFFMIGEFLGNLFEKGRRGDGEKGRLRSEV
jgi:hypothetical protein